MRKPEKGIAKEIYFISKTIEIIWWTCVTFEKKKVPEAKFAFIRNSSSRRFKIVHCFVTSKVLCSKAKMVYSKRRDHFSFRLIQTSVSKFKEMQTKRLQTDFNIIA